MQLDLHPPIRKITAKYSISPVTKKLFIGNVKVLKYIEYTINNSIPNTTIDKSLDNLQKKSINLDLGEGRLCEIRFLFFLLSFNHRNKKTKIRSG